MLTLSAIAFTIKLLLQAGSTIPSLSTIAFGFRPIVIGYLHLVLLGVMSLFPVGNCLYTRFIPVNKTVKTGLVIFCTGIIINEVLLMIQVGSAMDYISVPHADIASFVVACILFTGIACINGYTTTKQVHH